MDLSDRVSDQASESEEMSPERSIERLSSDCTDLKTCSDCGTTKTPLWRGGPAGPKSLCNACGIRSRKKRRAIIMGITINKEEKKSKKSTINKHKHNQINGTDCNSNSSSSGESSNKYIEDSLKKKLLTFGGKLAYQRPRSSIINQRKKLGEVEQAAFLLMALSCGSVYA